ncbi:CHASE3 domain-containing protein [Streptomyces sp. NPDC059881]|uniref:sensor histidine kinase n=1 Tax=Streptomyces sp. NPDC059881 TaxID=3346986 RepID=UPI0036652F91
MNSQEDPRDRTTGRRPGAPRARLTVPTWFGLVLAAILLVVGAFAVVGAQLLGRTAAESNDLVDRIQPARVDAYRLQKALLDQETGVRGFALSRDPRWLEPYTLGQKEAASAARALRPALAGEPQLLSDLTRVENTAGTWRTAHAEPLVERTRQGTLPVAAELQQSKLAFDQLRVQFGQLNRDLLAERTAARDEMHRTRSAHNWLFTGMLAAFVAIAAALGFLLHAAVGRPLNALRGAAQRVADGDFDHRIEPAGPAEAQQLATAVEAMRVRVLEALTASRQREELLAQRTADLDEQAVELRRSNAELEQFAYVASHDLQEPLRKVASFCQLLDKRYGDQLDDRAKQYIDFAVDGAKRMQVLINDLLTYSRVGRVNDDRDPVDFGATLDEALDNLGEAVEDAGATIERPERLHTITGDAVLLTMLWQNLLGNAVKFRAPDRPPVVRITAEPDTSGEEPAWHYCVTDNGIGIPEEFTEKVFVIFQRLHGRDVYSGTGIGLALCKKIVEHHGGRIWIDTAYTDGTRIHFVLPASPTGPEHEPETDPETDPVPEAVPGPRRDTTDHARPTTGDLA